MLGFSSYLQATRPHSVHPACHGIVVFWVHNLIVHRYIEVQGWISQHVSPAPALPCCTKVVGGCGRVLSPIKYEMGLFSQLCFNGMVTSAGYGMQYLVVALDPNFGYS